MAADHQPTFVKVPNTGQRGPTVFHQPTCSCGWSGTITSPDNAGYQHAEHIRTVKT